MASVTPRLPEPLGGENHAVADFHVNELAADMAGSLSPFGPEVEFPLPLDELQYVHPKPENRPYLAGGH